MKGVCYMPGGDQSGPTGSGPKSGLGFGYCSNNDDPGYDQEYDRGFRRGKRDRGFGRGFGRRGRGRGWHDFSSAGEDRKVRGLLQQILAKLDKSGNIIGFFASRSLEIVKLGNTTAHDMALASNGDILLAHLDGKAQLWTKS
jgi:hypothetical protein